MVEADDLGRPARQRPLLDRTADAGGLAGWSNLLKQGVRDEIVLANIMDTDSHEFFNKTAP